MTNNQKFLISLVLISISYFLFSITRYWLADVRYASAQNLLRAWQNSQDSQYLLSAYNTFASAFAVNKSEPAISSEYSVSAAYLANALAGSDATTAASLAQLSVSLSDTALSASPRHPNYYKSRARALILLSDLDPGYFALAADTLAKAAQISPTDPRLPYNLGVVYKYLNATAEAKLAFQKALELKPDFGDPAKQLQEQSP